MFGAWTELKACDQSHVSFLHLTVLEFEKKTTHANLSISQTDTDQFT